MPKPLAANAAARRTSAHSFTDECEFRLMLERLCDKWSMAIISTLHHRTIPRARFSELKREVPGISQRMLTVTLRGLERDGLLARKVHAEVPPRVEYELTPLGKRLTQLLGVMVMWLHTNRGSIRTARERFESRSRGVESMRKLNASGGH